METVKKITVAACIAAFVCIGTARLASEISACYRTFRRMDGLGNDTKREMLIGDAFVFASRCNDIIPRDARVLFLTNAGSNTSGADLQINYFMYPRRLLLLDGRDPYPRYPPSPGELDAARLHRRGITWILFRYLVPVSKNMIVRLENGREVQTYNLTVPEGAHDGFR